MKLVMSNEKAAGLLEEFCPELPAGDSFSWVLGVRLFEPELCVALLFSASVEEKVDHMYAAGYRLLQPEVELRTKDIVWFGDAERCGLVSERDGRLCVERFFEGGVYDCDMPAPGSWEKWVVFRFGEPRKRGRRAGKHR